ncbi:MAG: nucleotide exchange factor GrpE [Pseudobutyrivibrio sp.]|nr:nucleotide exchange factor GrpE [Pseudobutyrivibrio sp.]
MKVVAEDKEKMEEFSTEEAVKEAVENAEEMANESSEVKEEVKEEATEAEATDTEAEATEEKKKPFKKKEKKKDKRDEQIEQLTDRVTRQMAEFENFRRRTEQEKSQMFATGAKSIVEKILPVVDNFERGLATVEEGADPFSDGMLMIYKQMLTTLEEAGVKPIEAVGQEFNPDFHNAVMHVEDEEAGENIVVEEFQKGYMYNDTVVRHSMVKVAN